jgi:hypothetical protein
MPDEIRYPTVKVIIVAVRDEDIIFEVGQKRRHDLKITEWITIVTKE